MLKPITDLEKYLNTQTYSKESGAKGVVKGSKEDFKLTPEQEKIVRSLVALLVREGVEVMVFDLDDTLTAFHTFIDNVTKKRQIAESELKDLFANLAMNKALLKELREHNIEVVLMTLQRHNEVDKVLERGGLEDDFDYAYVGSSSDEGDERIKGDSRKRGYPSRYEGGKLDKSSQKIRALKQVGKKDGGGMKKIAMVSDKDPEELSWVEENGGVTFGIDEIRYEVISNDEAISKGLKTPKAYMDLLREIANIDDAEITRDEARRRGFTYRAHYDRVDEVSQLRMHVDSVRSSLKRAEAYFKRHGIDINAPVTAENLPLPPMEAPHDRRMEEFSFAQGWERVERGLSENNMRKFLADLAIVAFNDGKINQGEYRNFMQVANRGRGYAAPVVAAAAAAAPSILPPARKQTVFSQKPQAAAPSQPRAAASNPQPQLQAAAARAVESEADKSLAKLQRLLEEKMELLQANHPRKYLFKDKNKFEFKKPLEMEGGVKSFGGIANLSFDGPSLIIEFGNGEIMGNVQLPLLKKIIDFVENFKGYSVPAAAAAAPRVLTLQPQDYPLKAVTRSNPLFSEDDLELEAAHPAPAAAAPRVLTVRPAERHPVSAPKTLVLDERSKSAPRESDSDMEGYGFADLREASNTDSLEGYGFGTTQQVRGDDVGDYGFTDLEEASDTDLESSDTDLDASTDLESSDTDLEAGELASAGPSAIARVGDVQTLQSPRQPQKRRS